MSAANETPRMVPSTDIAPSVPIGTDFIEVIKIGLFPIDLP